MRILLESPWNYTLSEEEAGDFLLSVVCGTVGVYELTIRLNKAERERYLAEGEDYIQVLASNVCSNPGKYERRSVRHE